MFNLFKHKKSISIDDILIKAALYLLKTGQALYFKTNNKKYLMYIIECKNK